MNMHMPTGLINNSQIVNSGVNPSNLTQRPSNWLLYTYMMEPTLAVAMANSQDKNTYIIQASIMHRYTCAVCLLQYKWGTVCSQW